MRWRRRVFVFSRTIQSQQKPASGCAGKDCRCAHMSRAKLVEQWLEERYCRRSNERVIVKVGEETVEADRLEQEDKVAGAT